MAILGGGCICVSGDRRDWNCEKTRIEVIFTFSGCFIVLLEIESGKKYRKRRRGLVFHCRVGGQNFISIHTFPPSRLYCPWIRLTVFCLLARQRESKQKAEPGVNTLFCFSFNSFRSLSYLLPIMVSVSVPKLALALASILNHPYSIDHVGGLALGHDIVGLLAARLCLS